MAMKNTAYSLLAIFFMATMAVTSLCLTPSPYLSRKDGKHVPNGDQNQMFLKEGATGEIGRELQPTGSSLPDCTHACGACFPCKRVMVSFKCSVAESCPTIYRCMCRGRYYHVPSK